MIHLTAEFTPIPGGDLPAAAFSNLDMSLFEQFKIEFRDKPIRIQFRMQAFNALNHVNFQIPQANANINNGSFGVLTSAYPARIGQLALKVLF